MNPRSGNQPLDLQQSDLSMSTVVSRFIHHSFLQKFPRTHCARRQSVSYQEKESSQYSYQAVIPTNHKTANMPNGAKVAIHPRGAQQLSE